MLSKIVSDFCYQSLRTKKIALAAIEQQQKNVVGLASSSCPNTFQHQKSDNERDCKQTLSLSALDTFIFFNCYF